MHAVDIAINHGSVFIVLVFLHLQFRLSDGTSSTKPATVITKWAK
jgi:hypothetical protein